MLKNTYVFIIALLCVGMATPSWAGNPDRQGEAGAYELLMNPWARSAGLNGLVSANVTGVEALRFNPAGLARYRGTEFLFSNSQYLVGTGLSLNAAGLAQSIGDNGSLGVSFMSVTFGDIDQTTYNQPEGLTTFTPSFFNIGISYSHIFKDAEGNEKVSVGVTARVISESIANASAMGMAFDAGVQYVTGSKRQIKFGLALRNIGTKMQFKGDGFAFVGVSPSGDKPLTVEQRTVGYEMPSLLNIGVSYDFDLAEKHRLSTMINFTANSFSRDQYGVGVEYAFNEMFMVRSGFKYEEGLFDSENVARSLNTGLTAGFSVDIPFKKESNKRFGLDYAYEFTREFGGTHSIGARVRI